jgi:hypothetical protein
MAKCEMEGWERETMILGIQSMRAAPLTKFTAPGSEKKWRARDLVDIHWKLTGIETPSESYNRILSCLIGHANPQTGRCQVKQRLIAGETGYSVETVKRAVKWWESQGFLIKQGMGRAKSNAYHPQWDLFELMWVAIQENIKAQKEAWLDILEVTKGTHAGVIKGTHDECHHGDPHESQSRTSKDEPHPEWAHPPSASDAHVISSPEGKKEEGIQGEQEASSSLPPEGLTYGQAQEIVSGYCTGLHWEHLTQEDFDAAVAAEIEETGAGRAVVDAAAERNARETVNG